MFNFHNKYIAVICWLLLLVPVSTAPVASQSAQDQYGVIQNAASKASADVQAFYAERNYKPLWTGKSDRNRVRALLKAIGDSSSHGLPTVRYDAAGLKATLASARTSTEKANAELLATRTFLLLAQDMSSGVLEPRKIDREMAIAPPRRSHKQLLEAMAKSSPKGFLKSLAPKHPDYKRMQKEKQRLERVIGQGDWGGKVPIKTLRPGTSSKNVAAMRVRLTNQGYGQLGTATEYDDNLVKVVKVFQQDHGLNSDGIAGPATLRAMNVSAKERLKQVLVNMERLRWMNFNRGKRHISVNLADFSVSLMDNGKQSFKSRVVIGAPSRDRRSAEFHDQMTHMVVNPTWHVPRSIAGKEYLPILRKDPGFLSRRNMRMINASGQSVNPANVDLTQYSEKNFPYSIKQAPSKGNALGRVKFIFPNQFNIYLHDTPSKSLFNKDIRTFSHGCIRVQKPFEFAYKLLEKQKSDPKSAFHSWLNTGKEQYVNLEQPVPIYLGFHSTFFSQNGRVNYRADVYGRDKKVFNALAKAGVVLQAVQG